MLWVYGDMDVKQVSQASEAPVAEDGSDNPASLASGSLEAGKQNAPLWRRFLGLFWDTWEDDGEENKFTRKLDYILL
jgi:ACS family pantothenate transporter-like MFS transporter